VCGAEVATLAIGYATYFNYAGGVGDGIDALENFTVLAAANLPHDLVVILRPTRVQMREWGARERVERGDGFLLPLKFEVLVVPI
jgi:hypothetical protein